mmetsp:Transcript_47595/g.114213  ORF Transcript_47595/g.114213 Transcript_47595/m.114213 type:complete len:227 (+) Transcript_47595:407-1087(+)
MTARHSCTPTSSSPSRPRSSLRPTRRRATCSRRSGPTLRSRRRARARSRSTSTPTASAPASTLPSGEPRSCSSPRAATPRVAPTPTSRMPATCKGRRGTRLCSTTTPRASDSPSICARAAVARIASGSAAWGGQTPPGFLLKTTPRPSTAAGWTTRSPRPRCRSPTWRPSPWARCSPCPCPTVSGSTTTSRCLTLRAPVGRRAASRGLPPRARRQTASASSKARSS